MRIIDRGEYVEITESVAEINKRATDAGLPAPIIAIRLGAILTDIEITKRMTHHQYQEAVALGIIPQPG